MTTVAFLVCIAAGLSIVSIRYMGVMPGPSHTGMLPAAGPGAGGVGDRVAQQGEEVAAHERNSRNFAGVERVAGYLEKTLAGLGYRVKRQEFDSTYGSDVVKVRNGEAEVGGSSAAAEILIVGA